MIMFVQFTSLQFFFRDLYYMGVSGELSRAKQRKNTIFSQLIAIGISISVFLAARVNLKDFLRLITAIFTLAKFVQPLQRKFFQLKYNL